MNMKKHLLFQSVLVLFTVQTLKAQIPITKDLEKAIEKAWNKSSKLKNQHYELEKLENQRKGVLNKYLPHVSATVAYAYLDNDLTIDVPTKTTPILGIDFFEGETTFSNRAQVFHAGLNASMPLFTGMQIPNGAKAVEQKKQGTAYLLEVEKDQLIKEVINSFDQITLLNEAEKLIADSEKRLEKETIRVEKAISLGLAIPYDRDKIKYAALELHSKTIEIKGKRKLLYQKIQYLTDLSIEEIENTKYNLEPYLLSDSSLSIENKHELKALESFKSAQNYLLKKEKGSYLPTLGAFASVSHSNLFDFESNTTLGVGPINKDVSLKVNELTLSPNWMVGLALKWDVFSGFERKHKVEEAKINIAQMDNTIKDTREKLGLLLQQQYSNYEVATEKIAIAEQLQKVSENNLKMAIKQYQEGMISISERLEAENETFKANLNKVSSLIDQRLAAIETVITTGEINQYLTTND